MRGSTLRAVGLALLFLLGCSETRVDVWFDADEASGAGATAIRISVEGADGPAGMLVHDFDQRELPVAVALRPRGGDASRRYVVTGTLLAEDGAALATATADSYFVADEAREIRLRFDVGCGAVACDEERQTCSEGVCVDACVDPTPPGQVARSVYVDCAGGPPPPMPCTEGELRCAGDDLLRCVDGMTEAESCALGCDSADPRCLALSPSNLAPEVDLAAGTGDLVVGADAYWELDTDALVLQRFEGGPSGSPTEVTPEGVLIEVATLDVPGAPVEVALLRGADVRVEAGATFRAIGSRALIVVANGAAQIDGVLTVASDERRGAGGGRGGLAEVPANDDAARTGEGCGGGARGDGMSGVNHYSGGGGGGFGSAGGDGGDSPSIAGGAGGVDCASPDLVPLLGGSGGGTGGTGETRSGAGGHGGGALQLVATVGVVIGATGVIDASGAGAPAEPIFFSSGGGGGSGGALLIEAPTVVIEPGGRVGANGGGGSSAGCSNSRAAGEHGAAGAAPAAGGQGACNRGADGSAIDGTVGTLATADSNGGGGGGAGLVRFNVRTPGDALRYDGRVQPFVVDRLFYVRELTLR